MGEAGYESRSANCAFAGRALTGRVRMTIADGRGRLPRAHLRARGGGLVAPARVLDRDRAALVVVDVQEAFRPAVLDFDAVAAGAAALVRGARILGLPVVVTEQYPKGLGTHRARRWPSTSTGSSRSRRSASRPPRPTASTCGGRDQALVCGIESHVCVSQTAHDLLDRGVEVHVARDAVSSRTEENRELGPAQDGGRRARS